MKLSLNFSVLIHKVGALNIPIRSIYARRLCRTTAAPDTWSFHPVVLLFMAQRQTHTHRKKAELTRVKDGRQEADGLFKDRQTDRERERRQVLSEKSEP